MTSSDSAQPPEHQRRNAHGRIRVVPLRPTRFPVKRTVNLMDSRPVYLASKACGLSEGEFMRKAIMREAARTLANPGRRTA
jgi:hypothetical protein